MAPVNKRSINHYDIIGKIPPQAIDIEEAVLGALILESDAIHRVNGIVDSGSFYKEEHQKIFSSIKDLSRKNKPIDLLTVTRALKESCELDEVGGPVYITQLTSRVASAYHIEHHARIIAQEYLKREYIRISQETINEAFDPSTDIDDIASSVRQKFLDVEEYCLGNNTGQSQSEICKQAIKALEEDCKKSKSGEIPGISTGLTILNKATGGWRNTNLIILAARPSLGKTSLALFFTKIAAQNGKWVNFYGLEMKSPDLLRIMLSSESGISRTPLRDGNLEDHQWELLNRGIRKIENLPIIWNDSADITSSKIKSLTIRNRKRNQCDLIVIDYLQLIKPMDKKAIREQQVAEISRTLKEIALSENIPVICLSQLTREAANEKPQLHHLRESGAIEQDADVVIMPWRDNENNYNITIAKNRRGITGPFTIHANNEMTIFSDSKIESNPF
jgi:replicative DNA helicase